MYCNSWNGSVAKQQRCDEPDQVSILQTHYIESVTDSEHRSNHHILGSEDYCSQTSLVNDGMDIHSEEEESNEITQDFDTTHTITAIELRRTENIPFGSRQQRWNDAGQSTQCSPRSLADSDESTDDMDLSQDRTFSSAHQPSSAQTRERAIETERELVMHNWRLVRSMSAPLPPPQIPAGRAQASFLLRAASGPASPDPPRTAQPLLP